MRGIFVFLIMITIVMLGLAGCPSKEAPTDGQTAAPAAGTAGEDQTSAAEDGE